MESEEYFPRLRFSHFSEGRNGFPDWSITNQPEARREGDWNTLEPTMEQKKALHASFVRRALAVHRFIELEHPHFFTHGIVKRDLSQLQSPELLQLLSFRRDDFVHPWKKMLLQSAFEDVFGSAVDWETIFKVIQKVESVRQDVLDRCEQALSEINPR